MPFLAHSSVTCHRLSVWAALVRCLQCSTCALHAVLWGCSLSARPATQGVGAGFTSLRACVSLRRGVSSSVICLTMLYWYGLTDTVYLRLQSISPLFWWSNCFQLWLFRAVSLCLSLSHTPILEVLSFCALAYFLAPWDTMILYVFWLVLESRIPISPRSPVILFIRLSLRLDSIVNKLFIVNKLHQPTIVATSGQIFPSLEF